MWWPELKPRSASSSGSAARPGVPFRSSDKACCSERSVEGKTNCRRTGDAVSAIYPEGVAFQSPGFAVKPRTLGSADASISTPTGFDDCASVVNPHWVIERGAAVPRVHGETKAGIHRGR